MFLVVYELLVDLTRLVERLVVMTAHKRFGSTSHQFDEYAKKVEELPKSTTNEDLLVLYGLFKRVTVGSVDKPRPGGLFNRKDQAKWDAWQAVEGKSKEEAMRDYIVKVKQLLGEHSS
ncbi:Acyl-CoA-binding domain-containing protein 2 [Orobanche gracilis]